MKENIEPLDEYKEVFLKYKGIIQTYFHTKRVGETFHLFHLERFVSKMRKGPSQTTSRVLRDMREKGIINYRVINKHKSLYEVLPV